MRVLVDAQNIKEELLVQFETCKMDLLTCILSLEENWQK